MINRDFLARLQGLQIDINRQEAEQYRQWIESLSPDDLTRHYDKLRLFTVAELGLDLPLLLDTMVEEEPVMLDCHKALIAHSFALYLASQFTALLEHSRQG